MQQQSEVITSKTDEAIKVATETPKEGTHWAFLSFWLTLPLFAIIYTHHPIYSLNQNHYFLRAVAAVSETPLTEDWLANTTDTHPVFTQIAKIILQLFGDQAPAAFQLLFAGLCAIFLFSLVGIAVRTWSLEQKPRQILAISLGLITLFSPMLTALSTSTLGINIGHHLENGVAKQYVLGHYLQPSSFGVLLLLAVYFVLSNRLRLSVCCASFAATLHPSYLLPAAVITLICMAKEFEQNRYWPRAFLLGLLSLLLVLPVVSYSLTQFVASSPETMAAAQEILVYKRLPHHADVSTWFNGIVVFKLALIGAAILICRSKLVSTVLLVCAALGLLMTLAQQFLGSNFMALLFPWRISVILVPISTAVITGLIVSYAFERLGSEFDINGKFAPACVGLVIALIGVSLHKQRDNYHKREQEDNHGVFEYAKHNRKFGQLYMTPTDMDGLRLYAHVPVLANYKAMPYKDKDVLLWFEHLQHIDDFYAKGPEQACDRLTHFFDDAGVTHIVMPTSFDWPHCGYTRVLYQDQHFYIVGTDRSTKAIDSEEVIAEPTEVQTESIKPEEQEAQQINGEEKPAVVALN